MKTYFINYLIEDLSTGMQYIGSHKTTDPYDAYLGSGKLLVLERHLRDDKEFVKYILKFDNPDVSTMFSNEEKFIKEYNTLWPNGYNLSEKGGGYWDQEKIKQICKKRYGVENPFQMPEIQEKKKETFFKKYGVYHNMKSEKNKRKK